MVKPSARNTLLSANRIGRRHPASDGWLLREASLTISPGERVALVGPSGSGKTLLVRALALLDPIDHGEVLWNNEPVSSQRVPEFRRRVVYLHQRPWIGEGTVEDALRAPWNFHSAKSARSDPKDSYNPDRIAGWLESVGRRAAFYDQNARDLSGGESQIASLLRALQLDPQILLLDEPTGAMDQKTTRAAESLIKNWQEESPRERATLWITHDAEQTARVSNRVLKINKGRLHPEA